MGGEKIDTLYTRHKYLSMHYQNIIIGTYLHIYTRSREALLYLNDNQIERMKYASKTKLKDLIPPSLSTL